MVDHDSPISLSPSGGSIARAIVAEKNSEHWNLPEGTILASATRRGTSFAIDAVSYTHLTLPTTSTV